MIRAPEEEDGETHDIEMLWDDIDEQLARRGLTQDGACMLAGTEYCDWECRVREWELDDGDA